MVELDSPVIEGFIMASSKVGSGGFALSIGGCSGALAKGEGGLAGSDASTGRSSTGLATFDFLDLAWPLKNNIAELSALRYN